MGTTSSTPPLPLNSIPLIIGHRGSSAVAPENTLAAFSCSVRDGADGIEFDVQLARDQIPVVIHDSTLRRTAAIDRLVSELTASELQAIDVGKWFDYKRRNIGPSYAGERLPTLAQVFELFRSHSGLLYLEMKCEGPEQKALAAATVRLIEEFQMTDRVVVSSFELSAIGEVKKSNASIRTAALFEPKVSRPISTVRRSPMVDLALRQRADEIALHYTLAGPRIIDKAKQSGLEIVVWTVDDPDWITRARSLGIKALITNNPQNMLTFRNAPPTA
ncbi:MAG: glycerophosphodiester phosphodiesterase [Pyrinomonadaceae bacterium]